MPSGLMSITSRLRTPPSFDSSAFGESTSGSGNITAITSTAVSVTRSGGIIAALMGRHSNWVNTYDVKTITSNQGSTFTEIPGSDQARGPGGQRQGHVILFYCANPVIGDHILTGNVQASQALAGLRICASFASNAAGWRNLTVQTSTGNVAVSLAIPASAGSLTYVGIGENSASTGNNWTDLSAAADLSDRACTRGSVAADGTINYTGTSTQQVCAAGVELYAA